MELQRKTCLSRGGGFHFPPSHILNICGFRILFDVPLDLSALSIFSPVPTGFDASFEEEIICSSEFDAAKRQKIETSLEAKDLIYAEPWYKTATNLHLWNASFIDVVLISSPMGMLGLPFLTRTKGFSAKIYVTEAAARLGQLMMEDLFSMHMEFRQFYGAEESGFPRWMKWENLERLPSMLKEIALGKDGGELGGWMPLYRSLAYADDSSEEREKLAFVCSCAIDAVKTGGSVLIPINRLGIILQLLEQISAALESSNLKVPIYFISSVSEELLAFTNVIPEWLCRDRQEKLFSGDPLFGHMELLKEKKLRVFPAIHSSELLMNWQEPCIVFSPHWSLRLGPVVHLLRRWCGDQNSLLVLENSIDAELALLPFKPMTMKVLQCSFLSGIKLTKVKPLLETLQPKFVLFPKDLKQINFPFSVLHYSENETLRIPSLKNSSEVEISMDLATQFHFRKLKQEGINVTRLKGDLVVDGGKHKLLSENKHSNLKCMPILHWGSPDPETLLATLSRMGIKGTIKGTSKDSESQNIAVLYVHEPNKASIEIQTTSTVITAANEDLASRISEAIGSVLDGV
ncbi:hypothetical protein UlMin_007489 [Ulmus minor]